MKEGSKPLKIETNNLASCAKISICTEHGIINNMKKAW
jgi:hypothetical protein